METITVRLQRNVLKRLNEHCKRYGYNRSAVIRLAIIELLRRREHDAEMEGS